ncbi:hypothetical protein MMC11_003297 [Xylographa trunciseda]|nr:hypothetical protein [Xylographa trunciseda]
MATVGIAPINNVHDDDLQSDVAPTKEALTAPHFDLQSLSLLVTCKEWNLTSLPKPVFENYSLSSRDLASYSPLPSKMFRRIESSLPKDFHFPADLEGLGYKINDKDQIRSIEVPDREFHYFISKNERCVEMQREAMNSTTSLSLQNSSSPSRAACIRMEVLSRLAASSMDTVRLPIGATAEDNHVPVLVSSHLPTAKRVIVYVGESCQDLGIFAYRLIGADTIASGSAAEFINHVKTASRDPPAVILANPGQLTWYRRGQRAMTQHTWHALPRKTAVSQPLWINSVRNLVPQNENIQKHVACLFEQVVAKLPSQNARVDIIGIGDGALEVVEYLQQDWKKWQGKIDAIAVGASHIWNTDIKDESFGEFWGRRGRAYLISPEILDAPLTGREEFGCNCFSSGEPSYVELIMPKAYKSMLDYFKVVADNPGYEAEPQNFSGVKGSDERHVGA